MSDTDQPEVDSVADFDPSTDADLALPQVSRRPWPSVVWVIPLLTLLVGIWLIYYTLSEQGPVVSIRFQTAEGIEVGKTRIKYKNVDVGLIEDVQFSEDFESVLLTARFNPGTEHFLRRNTRFWVVKPQLSVRGVTGLETLISGSWIQIDPGPGAPQRHFVGLEVQPMVTADTAGTRITLLADSLGSLGRGSPIYYQGILAGEILGYELASDARSVFLHAFIRDPYNGLVKGHTRFWNVSGIDLSMGADGLDLRTASLTSLMFGGIAFDTPPTLQHTPGDVTDLIYTLHDSYASIEEAVYTRKLQFVMYFSGSVRGLKSGAPVEFRGIRVGQVLDVRLEVDPEAQSFQIPVLVEIEPQRIIDRSALDALPEQTFKKLVDQGLKGRLETGNLLTGSLYVSLDLYPDTPVVLRAGADSTLPELPTTAGSFEALTASLEGFVDQLETIDIEAMGNSLESILGEADALLKTDGSQTDVTDLQASLHSLKGLLQTLDEASLDQTVTAANTLLGQLESTLSNLDLVLEPGSPLQYSATKTLNELEDTLKGLRALLEVLERNPQSILFGRSEEAAP